VAKRFAVMRDLHDHLRKGKLGPFELGVYQIIHWQADFKTGVWWGSAPAIHCVAPYGCSLRDVQRAIEKLTRIGFLVPFHKRGKRGNFPVLIHKYEPLSGALRGRRLNALKSADWRTPLYESCAETDTDVDAETDAEAAPNQEVRSKKKSADAGKPSSALPPEPKIETDDRSPVTTFVPSTSKLEKQRATAKAILLKDGFAEPLIELAFVRALDINEAKRMPPPRSVAWFLVAAKNTLSDPEEREELETILANRTVAGIPAIAPLGRLEKPVVSKIAFVHAAVEEAARRGARASDVLAEKLA
jgi:hypothetical protein